MLTIRRAFARRADNLDQRRVDEPPVGRSDELHDKPPSLLTGSGSGTSHSPGTAQKLVCLSDQSTGLRRHSGNGRPTQRQGRFLAGFMHRLDGSSLGIHLGIHRHCSFQSTSGQTGGHKEPQTPPNRPPPQRQKPERGGDPQRPDPPNAKPHQGGEHAFVRTSVRPNTRSTGPDRPDPDRPDPDRTGPTRTDPDRTGPDRTGPDRTGPTRTGPTRTPIDVRAMTFTPSTDWCTVFGAGRWPADREGSNDDHDNDDRTAGTDMRPRDVG